MYIRNSKRFLFPFYRASTRAQFKATVRARPRYCRNGAKHRRMRVRSSCRFLLGSPPATRVSLRHPLLPPRSLRRYLTARRSRSTFLPVEQLRINRRHNFPLPLHLKRVFAFYLHDSGRTEAAFVSRSVVINRAAPRADFNEISAFGACSLSSFLFLFNFCFARVFVFYLPFLLIDN